jgi:16S rRNA processing protein RimM
MIDQNLGNIGKVADVLEGNEQFLLQFYHQNAECFLPLVDEFVLEVNKETRTVHTQIPDGLLEIYTQK